MPSLDGQSTGPMLGGDDGVVINDETDAVVDGNHIQNVWDCGIEVVGAISASLLQRNHVLNAACGIGGWYNLSVSATTVARNTVDGAFKLLSFYRVGGLRPAGTDFDHVLPADTAVTFKDNRFEANVLLNPRLPATGPYGWASYVPLFSQLDYNPLSRQPSERQLQSSDFLISNNVFVNNDFGHVADTVNFGAITGTTVPPGLMTDGGGNICKMPASGPYPLTCQ